MQKTLGILTCLFSSFYKPFMGLVIIIASLSCFPSVAQNLVMNPKATDMNVCCEAGMKCRPEGWFSTDRGVLGKKQNGKQYISVNPIKSPYDLYPVYYVIALYSNVNPDKKYQFELITPGNDKVRLFFTFIDSTLIYTDSQTSKHIIDSLLFDSIIVKGKKNATTIQPQTTGNYLILMLQNIDDKIGSSYNQHIESISLRSLSAENINMEEMKRRKDEVYSENRAHFDTPCPQKNTL